MGYTGYSVEASSTRYSARATMDNCTVEKNLFTSRKLDPEMDIKNKIRECRDLEGKDPTFPIIVSLDVTGSMGGIPVRLIKNDLNIMMTKILEAGVKNPQLLFIAIGDHAFDSSPIQVGQFEANDELLEKWLTTTYLERGGGSNAYEDYEFAHIVAARHTDCDAINIRKQKGLLITIGDEPNCPEIDRDTLTKYLGNGYQSSISAEEAIDEAKKNWNIYHINILNWSGKSKRTQDCWKSLLGDNLINIDDTSNASIADIIADLAIKHYESSKITTDLEKRRIKIL